MWRETTERLRGMVAEAQSLPDASDVIVHAKQHIASLPAAAATLEGIRNRILDHVATSKAKTAQAILLVSQRGEGLAPALQAYAAEVTREVEVLNADINRAIGEVAAQRSLMGEDAGRLSAAAMDARSRLKSLEQRKAELEAKARELRDRSIWTWIFLPAKAIDELVSAFQHGKSTEAAMEDALRQIADAQREASVHIRAQDLCAGMSELLKQFAANLQGLVSELAILNGELSGEDNLAKLASADTAAICLNAILKLLQIIEMDAA